jgi:hypothetical protein
MSRVVKRSGSQAVKAGPSRRGTPLPLSSSRKSSGRVSFAPLSFLTYVPTMLRPRSAAKASICHERGLRPARGGGRGLLGGHTGLPRYRPRACLAV